MINENDLLISEKIDKEPYIKEISDDKIINLTGESGSGKSYFTNKYINGDNYIIIDTDEVFVRFEKSFGINKQLGEYFRNKYNELPSLFDNFDLIYIDILEYFKGSDKTIIIDSAQFRNIKDYSLLKGKVIVMRTCIDTCYKRCVDRYVNNNDCTLEQLEQYKNKKYGMYTWYKGLNEFLEQIDKL